MANRDQTISVRSVTKRYLGSRVPVDTLVDGDLDVPRGEINGIKSTPD